MRGFELFVAVAATALAALAQGWSPKLAADYLDVRQQEWNAWKPAQASGGACFSCHTNMTYLLARPSLRRALGETEPTRYEKAALEGLRRRVDMQEAREINSAFTQDPLATQATGVETVFAAYFLAVQDHGGPVTPKTERALERLWRLQARGGKSAGSWPWFLLDLDPWETTESPYYGAAFASMAFAAAPAAYRERPEVRERIVALNEYLRAATPAQPLHNRMLLLWVGGQSKSAREYLIDEIVAKQLPDGGWAIGALGPFKQRPQAPASEGGNAYATAYTAFLLERGGVPRSNPALSRALDWLRRRQDPKGYWDASSMNKHFPAGSMQEGFMRDAATAFAVLALVEDTARP
jgi:squalene-hopene/tetraprenyl-beta-curcumene cyclase